ncbi:MAG: NADPH-dependent F420 reductase [Chloroflexota bacterium]
MTQPDAPKHGALLARTDGAARMATVAEAAEAGEVVVLATPWEAVPAALAAAGPMVGKILFDCTNPLVMKDGHLSLALGFTTSAGEKVALWAPGARVVKVFNTVGYDVMENPRFGERAASMLYASDDFDAKVKAEYLARDLGFEPIDAGPLVNARLLEPLAMTWIWLAMQGGVGRSFAFGLLCRRFGRHCSLFNGLCRHRRRVHLSHDLIGRRQQRDVLGHSEIAYV